MIVADVLKQFEAQGRSDEVLQHVVRVGVVTATDPKRGTVRVQCQDQDGLCTYDYPVLCRKVHKDKDYQMPDVGDHGVVLCLPNGQEQGFYLGSFYSEADATPVQDQDKHHQRYEDGTWFEYDRKEHKLTGEIKGDVELLIEKSAKVEVLETAEITVHQDATVDSKQTLYLKGRTAVQVRTPLFGVGPYDEDGSTAAVFETDLLHKGKYEHEGDTVHKGDTLQTGNQRTEGEIEAELFIGPWAGGGEV